VKELLALEERIGDAKSHGASQEDIQALPTTIIEMNEEEIRYYCLKKYQYNTQVFHLSL
jgi:hypothetical protein